MSDSKVCSKCGIEHPLTDFNKDKTCKDGYHECCRKFVNNFQKNYYKKHKLEKPKKYIEWGRKRTERRKNNKSLRKKHSIESMNWYNKNKETLIQKRHESYIKNKDIKNLKRRTRYKANEEHRLKVLGYVDYRKRKFGFNQVFPNEIDEPIERHHFNHNDDDYVCEPTELHEIYPGRDKEHRSNNLPILIQLYPILFKIYPDLFGEFPGIILGPVL